MMVFEPAVQNVSQSAIRAADQPHRRVIDEPLRFREIPSSLHLNG
jgi:hypothetical protein